MIIFKNKFSFSFSSAKLHEILCKIQKQCQLKGKIRSNGLNSPVFIIYRMKVLDFGGMDEDISERDKKGGYEWKKDWNSCLAKFNFFSKNFA